jgi:hypothetical protein
LCESIPPTTNATRSGQASSARRSAAPQARCSADVPRASDTGTTWYKRLEARKCSGTDTPLSTPRVVVAARTPAARAASTMARASAGAPWQS